MTEQSWLELNVGDKVNCRFSPYAQDMTIKEIYSLVVDHSLIIDTSLYQVDKKNDSEATKKMKNEILQNSNRESTRLNIYNNWVKNLGNPDISVLIQFEKPGTIFHTWDADWNRWEVV